MKRKNKFFNKRGQVIGATWDMIIGFLVVILILFIFLVISYFIAEKRIFFGSTDNSVSVSEDSMQSFSLFSSLMNSPVTFNGTTRKVKDILVSFELYNLDPKSKSELRNLLKNQIIRLIGGGVNKCYIFQAAYGINDSSKMSNVDPRGAQYVGDFLDKSTLQFSNIPDNVDPRASQLTSGQESKMLDKSIKVILIRDVTKNVFGVDEGVKQKIYIKFYNGEC